MKRREILKLAGLGLTLWQLPNSAAQALTKQDTPNSKKIIWIMLRGGMDGLHAVLPSFDKHLLPLRNSLVKPIVKDALPLQRGFKLHPALSFMHQLYLQKQMSPIVAVSTPYRERSHFSAQDLLEGGRAINEYASGWLGRALTETQYEGLAIAKSVPLTLRGEAIARTWYPSNLPEANDELYSRLMKLYENDPLLKQRLSEALDTQALANTGRIKGQAKLATLAKSCASLLRNKTGPQCAMLEMGGWDTHYKLVPKLHAQFQELDEAIKILHDELGAQWNNTAIIVATEFGRTVKVNGAQGSDHGTASTLFLAGGAIQGGQVYGKWPGLEHDNLFEGRDLKPTSDTFSWISTVIQQHWGLSDAAIKRVFPDTQLLKTSLIV